MLVVQSFLCCLVGLTGAWNLGFTLKRGLPSSGNASLSSFHLLNANPQTTDQLTSLARYLDYKSSQGEIDIWKLTRNLKDEVTFAVLSEESQIAYDWLDRNNIPYHVNNKDLQSLADNDAARERRRRHRSQKAHRDGYIDLNLYNDLDQINQYIQEAADDCSVCRIINIGQSYEHRDMDVIKIGSYVRGKRAVWLDAGIHAREWIAPATALKIVNYFVEGLKSNDREVQWMVDNFIWYILPLANPDGYHFSRTDNRYWRKTRRPSDYSDCVGADPNRNWGFHFGEASTSPDPCSDIYPGRRAFSEVEVRNIRKFLIKRRRLVQVYMSIHSYSQLLMYPWGFNSSKPEDWEEMHRVGQHIVDSMYRVDKKEYGLGSIANIIYPASGSSGDWVKSALDIDYTFAYELRDRGENGFLLPSEQIDPQAREVWAGLVAMAKAIKNT